MINRTELITAATEKTELPKKDAGGAVKASVDAIPGEPVKSGRVQLVGSGTFEVSERATREGRNPKTDKTMTTEASETPKFKVGKVLKDKVNK